MIRSTLLPLLLVSGIAFAGTTTDTTKTTETSKSTTMASNMDDVDFDKLDKNNDKMIDRVEARAHATAKLDTVYDQIDNDKNGSLSRAELDVWKKEKSYAMSDSDRSLFVKLDANKDRQIDKTEASAAADVMPSFSFADDDSNGKLSETEWMKWRQETGERMDDKDKSEPMKSEPMKPDMN